MNHLRRVSAIVALMMSAAAVAACGNDPPPITLDPLPTTTAPPGTFSAGADVTTTTASSAVPLPASVGESWVPVTANLAGMSSECGNLSLVSAQPDADFVAAGVALHGLWALNPSADTWEPLGQGTGSDQITNRATALVFDPEHPGTFWESGGYNGGGVFKTVDNGATFKHLGDVNHIDLVSVDLTDPERRTLLAGRHEAAVLHRSTDGGQTWTDISASLPGGIGYAAAPHVIDAQVHLLGTKSGPQAGVFRTVDGGATWTTVYPQGVNGSPVVAPDGLYWLLDGGNGVIKSNDQGATWTLLTGPGPIARTAPSLVRLPNGWLATVGSAVVVSPDDGATWRAVGPPFPYPPNGFTYSPTRQAFYIWRWDCLIGQDNPIPPDAIMHLDFAL